MCEQSYCSSYTSYKNNKSRKVNTKACIRHGRHSSLRSRFKGQKDSYAQQQKKTFENIMEAFETHFETQRGQAGLIAASLQTGLKAKVSRTHANPPSTASGL